MHSTKMMIGMIVIFISEFAQIAISGSASSRMSSSLATESLLTIAATSTSQTPCVDSERNCSFNGEQDCLSDDYRGNKAETVNGLTCQIWNSFIPHGHPFSFVGDHNFCRNPNGLAGPWCYTTNTSVRWEFCFSTCSSESELLPSPPTTSSKTIPEQTSTQAISQCVDSTKDCAFNGEQDCLSDDYQGKKAETVNGRSCQVWSSSIPHGHSYSYVGDHNFCRNPDAEPGPWCYTTDPSIRWELCFSTCSTESIGSIPEQNLTQTTIQCVYSTKDCAYNGVQDCRSDNYLGNKTETVNGRTCQLWSSYIPHGHSYSYVGDHNFCRNPDEEPGPWCYTTDSSVRWELCFSDCGEADKSAVSTTPSPGTSSLAESSLLPISASIDRTTKTGDQESTTTESTQTLEGLINASIATESTKFEGSSTATTLDQASRADVENPIPNAVPTREKPIYTTTKTVPSPAPVYDGGENNLIQSTTLSHLLDASTSRLSSSSERSYPTNIQAGSKGCPYQHSSLVTGYIYDAREVEPIALNCAMQSFEADNNLFEVSNTRCFVS